LLFRAQLAAPFTFSSGPESLEVDLFDPADIPFDQVLLVRGVLLTPAVCTSGRRATPATLPAAGARMQADPHANACSSACLLPRLRSAA
jgi:hypothetical protein